MGAAGSPLQKEVKKDEPTTNTLLGSPGSPSDGVLAEAQRIAANEPNLSDVERQALIRAIQTRRMRERGEVPPHYTEVTVCAHCGPVPIFPGVTERVLGCPWCFNRMRSLPIPKVSTKTKEKQG